MRRRKALAIPPAWTDVWICPNPRGHIQTTGRDARGRKQYRHHARWRAVRDDTKYGRLVAFGEALPRIRAVTEKHLALLDSDDVNAYLREITGQDFTAKDFRTWMGTVLACQRRDDEDGHQVLPEPLGEDGEEGELLRAEIGEHAPPRGGKASARRPAPFPSQGRKRVSGLTRRNWCILESPPVTC